MKILAIRGRNLASLEGEFEIDFTCEPLVSAGIFAISGPTGAGKSTILDAMCLSLFAKTPRTDQARENNIRLKDISNEPLVQGDPRFLLRRGTASCYAETDFLALNGNRYRSRWAVSRAREKEDGRLQQARISLFDLDNEKEEQGTRTELQNRITELIGLSFEQFTRSVLLAQNDFSTFLKAEQGEKASLLEKLTGTEHYSAISKLIYEKNARAKEAYEKIKSTIQGIELLPEEEEAALQQQLKETTTLLGQLESAAKELNAIQEAVRVSEQQISLKQQQQEQTATRLQESVNLLEKAQTDYTQATQELQVAEQTYQALLPQIRQARKLDVQVEAAIRMVEESRKQLAEASRQRKEREDKLNDFQLRLKKGEAEVRQLKDWFEANRSRENAAVQLSSLLLHLDAAMAARQVRQKLNEEIQAARQAIAGITTQVAAIDQQVGKKKEAYLRLNEQIAGEEEALNRIDPEALEKQLTLLHTRREELLLEQARLMATGDIKTMRDNLVEGTPCPVCGSYNHPYASAEASRKLVELATAITSATEQVQQLSAQSELYTRKQKQLVTLRQQLVEAQQQLVVIEKEKTELTNKSRIYTEQIELKSGSAKEQEELAARAIREAGTLFGYTGWEDNWMKNPATFRNSLTDFARGWQEKKEKLQQLEQEQRILQTETDSFRGFLPVLVKQEKEAMQLLEQKQQQLLTLQEERNGLLEGKKAADIEQQHTLLLEGLKEKRRRLLEVQTEQAGKAEQLRGISLQVTRELAEENSRLETHRRELQNWQLAYQEKFRELPLQESIARLTREKNECDFRLRTHLANQQKVAALQEQLNQCRHKSEQWAKLNELAGSADGAKFRRIAQGYTLDMLLDYANMQLRNLSWRYRLERVPDTLALQVIDREMCDEIRTVHSLSGGESFLVSLALALGLSSLSSNRMKVESLFIDEGFGSLDAETLRIALDALENLRTQGRKIGVISHVQEMTERIAVRIKVSRASNGRSYLEIS